MIRVQVCYASPQHQWLKTLEISAPISIKEVIELSGILQDCPEINLSQQKVGIWSKAASLETLVKEGDRVEIYRPLTIDPKQARFLRVRKKELKR